MLRARWANFYAQWAYSGFFWIARKKLPASNANDATTTRQWIPCDWNTYNGRPLVASEQVRLLRARDGKRVAKVANLSNCIRDDDGTVIHTKPASSDASDGCDQLLSMWAELSRSRRQSQHQKHTKIFHPRDYHYSCEYSTNLGPSIRSPCSSGRVSRASDIFCDQCRFWIDYSCSRGLYSLPYKSIHRLLLLLGLV